MNCAAFENILADYIDGTLSDASRVAFEQHAASCSGCNELMAEAIAGASLLKELERVDPPAELITRLAYLAPAERLREPHEQQGPIGRMISAWLRPVLQPRLAMGMAMTILSFAMLERCTGIQVQRIQPGDLSPARVWGGVEDKVLRIKDQAVKYYDNLRIVYEVETHFRELQEQQDAGAQTPPSKPRSVPHSAGGNDRPASSSSQANHSGIKSGPQQ